MPFKKKKKSRKEKAFNILKKGMGAGAHRAGWSIIRLPVELLQQHRGSEENPDKLKSFNFKELLERWEIPREKIPRLKRTLIAEMFAYGFITCLVVFGTFYEGFSPNYGTIKLLLGILIGALALLHFFMRHHWYLILSREKYRTFKEYLLIPFKRGN